MSKYLALLVILPLFTVALAVNYPVDVNAEKASGTPRDYYGSNNGVCGDKLCANVPADEKPKVTKKSGDPSVELYGIKSMGDNLYKATFKVYAGSDELPAGMLSVSSDTTQKDVPRAHANADSATYVSALITANERDSIQAEL